MPRLDRAQGSLNLPLRDDLMPSVVSMGAASSVASELELTPLQLSPSMDEHARDLTPASARAVHAQYSCTYAG